MSIFDYYKGLTGYKAKQEFRKKVMERCDISYPTFQLKVHNDTWTKLEREAVGKSSVSCPLKPSDSALLC